MFQRVRHERFHGRHEREGRRCDWQGCDEQGEFRAPGPRPSGADGPGDYRWFCLEHVRAFNAQYDFFAGMSSDAIFAAQSPLAGWETETRAFRPTGGIDSPPRWADFADPLEAIGARARAHADQARGRAATAPPAAAQGMAGRARFSPDERRALDALGLDPAVDRTALRRRYSMLVRRYHPDRNGGDRSKEALLTRTIAAYKLLARSPAFA